MSVDNPIDTFNFAGVGTRGADIVMVFHSRASYMTNREALILAAWLVTLAEGNAIIHKENLPTFEQILRAVQNA